MRGAGRPPRPATKSSTGALAERIGAVVARQDRERERRVLDGAAEDPDVVRLHASGTTPVALIRPCVGLNPTTPQ